MMTTLNTIEIMKPHPICGYLLLVALVCVIVSMILCNTRFFNTNVFAVFTAVGIVFSVLGIIALIAVPEIPTGKFQIEATFTKDFPFTSVMEQYTVIEQRGDIFLLEPKGVIE